MTVALDAVVIAVEAVATDRNVIVARNHAVGNDTAGFIYRGPPQVIGVNTATSPRRQRWTIARGLGHLELHKRELIIWRDIQIEDRVGSIATVLEECEANAYAGDLLLPRDLVVDVLAEEMARGHDSRDALIQAVARRFEVSNEAAGWRMISLCLIGG